MKPLHYVVAVLREGRTFSTRRVSVSQGGVTAMEALVSFLEPIDGDEYQSAMSAVPEPATLPTVTDQLAAYLGDNDEEYLGPMRPSLVDPRCRPGGNRQDVASHGADGIARPCDVVSPPGRFHRLVALRATFAGVSGGVGLGTGAIYNRDGTLVCTVTQEGFVGRRL